MHSSSGTKIENIIQELAKSEFTLFLQLRKDTIENKTDTLPTQVSVQLAYSGSFFFVPDLKGSVHYAASIPFWRTK